MRSILDKVNNFLNENTEVKEVKEAVKPFPVSALHEMTTEDIKNKLLEARRGQHWLKQFSVEELEHRAFVLEATSILEYRKNIEDLGERVVSVKKDGDLNVTSAKTVSDSTSMLHKALNRALSTQKKLSPVQVQRNKDRWAKRQETNEESVELDEATYGDYTRKEVKVGDNVGIMHPGGSYRDRPGKTGSVTKINGHGHVTVSHEDGSTSSFDKSGHERGNSSIYHKKYLVPAERHKQVTDEINQQHTMNSAHSELINTITAHKNGYGHATKFDKETAAKLKAHIDSLTDQ